MAQDGDQKSSFDRDFGYLLPFFDRVEAAASELTAPGAAEELRQLMAGEKAKWTRIRELLAGSPGRAPTGQDLRAAPSPAPVAAQAAARAQYPSDFTIGSLRSTPVRPAKDRSRDG